MAFSLVAGVSSRAVFFPQTFFCALLRAHLGETLMFWSIHATKGGVGTSVIAASLALELVASEPWSAGVILVDFGGDQGDILGVDLTDRLGIVDWLTSPDPVEISSLENLLVAVAPGLSVLPTGNRSLPDAGGSIDPGRIADLVRGLDELGTVVADLGVVDQEVNSPRCLIAAASTRRTLILRPCYLALRRATKMPITVDSVVEVAEDGRSLRTLDIEAVMHMAVSARLRVDPSIARAVDSGTLVSRRPRALRRFVSDLLAEFEVDRSLANMARGGGDRRTRNAMATPDRAESW